MIRLLRPDYPVLVLSCLAFIVLFSVGLHGTVAAGFSYSI